uniref:Uncharacterized protein n=1 Tax=Anguilla anguilla TaxID=7936 RepID=A0A0E9W081_ANGAN
MPSASTVHFSLFVNSEAVAFHFSQRQTTQAPLSSRDSLPCVCEFCGAVWQPG